jgi:hypothetical protein
MVDFQHPLTAFDTCEPAPLCYQKPLLVDGLLTLIAGDGQGPLRLPVTYAQSLFQATQYALCDTKDMQQNQTYRTCSG